MFAVVKIGTKDVPMLAMGNIDLCYWNVFHEDAIKMQSDPSFSVGDSINLLQKMGYVMAMYAEKKSAKDLRSCNYDTYAEWLGQFERNDLLEAIGAIRDVYEGNAAPSSTAKKNTDQQSEE